jgi:hypothetical protein
MPRFSPEIQVFLKKYVGGQRADETKLSLLPRSASMLNTGDLIIFKYYMPADTLHKRRSSKTQRLGLIVSNKRSSTGTFISSQKNLLLSCFRLDATSQQITSIVVEKLYKERRLCNYYKIVKSLKTILGKDKYRTYKVSQLSNIYEVTI